MFSPAVHPQKFMPTPAFTLQYGDEELAVLPPQTKVVVTGNNRTRSVLVGLQGVVKKSVGLGGWHWLVLTNGVEVKLQRNALSVIEAPVREEQHECVQGPLSGASHFGSAKQPQGKLTVDIRKLGAVSLWRYWRHYKLEGKNFRPSSKEQLIEVVQRHFVSQQLDEFQVIAGFLHAAKRLRESVHGHPY
uniref:Histone deacetylase complex subunit SAP30L n=1 Tax=Anthurium amnicola TaxID=1678845 RepID=A0A1D1Z862_9ARAE